MEESKKYNRQLEINDLIDDATNNALARRGLLESLSDDEAASVGGGRTLSPTIAGFKTICPPTKPTIKPIEPVCVPTKPICPPTIVGLMAAPDRAKRV